MRGFLGLATVACFTLVAVLSPQAAWQADQSLLAERPPLAWPSTTAPRAAGSAGARTPSSASAVLWNQLPATSGWSILSHDFEPEYADYDAFGADDFVNNEPWTIETVFVAGNAWDAGCDLFCADELTWQIYADSGGAPDGDPAGGGNPPVWSISLAPTDAQVRLSRGIDGWFSDVTLNLSTPIAMPPGIWWLTFYATISYDACECYYGRLVSDTVNASAAQVINPGGGWPWPSGWTSIQDNRTYDRPEHDLAFRLEGRSAAPSLAGRVWYDTNQDGIQDSGEPGVAGIGVDLYGNGTCTGQALASDATAAGGSYSFPGLQTNTYCLQFHDIPDGWLISPQDQGADDTVDSDADPATGQIQEINLTTGDLDKDMGLYAQGSIGDTVWCDADRDGRYDPGEGVAGVTVGLQEDTRCDGTGGRHIASQDTVGDGQYLFNSLSAGPAGAPVCYVVEVDPAGLGDCDNPFTPTAYAVPLDVDNPDDLDNDFGFVFGPAQFRRVYLPLVVRSP